MAKPIKRGKTWRVEVCAGGVRESATFPHRATAEQWAADRRRELLAMARGQVIPGKTLRHALERWRDEIAPKRRGWAHETKRITAWCKPVGESDAALECVDTPLERLTSQMLAEWRDKRLKAVSAGSVLRDFSLLSAIMEHARREWKWLTHNPCKDVRKPASPPSRERRVSDAEMELLRQQLGEDVRTVRGRIWLAARFALLTGMRVGEITALTWADVSPKSVAVTGKEAGAGKTLQAIRAVPLSIEARGLIDRLRGLENHSVFLLRKPSVDTLFRRAVVAAGLVDLHFHDLRHEFVTRVAGSNLLDVMSLARVVGHADPKMLLKYYNPSADDLADRLG